MDFLKTDEIDALQNEGALIIDTRPADVFCLGFLDGAVSVPFNEQFFERLSELFETGSEFVFVTDDAYAANLFKAFKASGLGNAKGYINGDYDTWRDARLAVDILISIEADEFAADYRFDEFYLLDLRSREEYETEHAEDSENIALADVEQMLVDLETDETYYLYGNTAEDAVTAGSLFKRNGFEKVRAVAEPFDTIKKSGVEWYVRKKKDGSAK